MKDVFHEGDHVRDRTERLGTVLSTWGNGVRVRWMHNLNVEWVDERFLHRDFPDVETAK